nr:ISAs1 family transposase [Parabacteroides sp. FAFU027]
MSKKTVEVIIKSRNNYIIRAKANQPNLYNQIKLNTSNQDTAIDGYDRTDKTRNRTEHRRISIFSNINGISKEWTGLKRIIKAERTVHYSNGKIHQAVGYYISSVKSDSAEFFAKNVRSHWCIENRLHWVKDVTMNEDKSFPVGGFAPENISILRNISINIYRNNGFDSIKHAIERHANKVKELFALVSSKAD